MLPFHQTLLLWRLQRGLTQDALARRARIPRPNLSAMERGHREVSLSTLRALALALEIRPGMLADGVPPGTAVEHPSPLSREAMERVAAAVVCKTPARNAHEQRVSRALRHIVRNRLAISSKRRRLPRGQRASQVAWVWLRATYPQAVVQSLLQRIADHQRRHDSTAN